MKRPIIVCSLGLLFVLTGPLPAPAASTIPPAATIPATELVATGGNVQVEILSTPPGIVFTSNIFTFSTSPPLFIGTNREVGAVADLGAFPAGSELVLGIGTPDGFTYVTGVGERNPDGIVHAIVEADGSGAVTVRFEDLFAGGDLSYSDVVIRVTGAMVR